MANGTSARFFAPVTFDFLWESAGLGELPYPLRVPSHGATVAERTALRHRVDEQLRAEGVRDSYGRLDPTVGYWLMLLARASMSIDTLHVPEVGAAPVAGIAASDGQGGVLAVQDSEGIRLRSIYQDGAVTEIVNLLPPSSRGAERSVTISAADAARTAAVPATAAGGAVRSAAERQEGGLAERLGFGRRSSSHPKLSERTAGDQRQDYARLVAQPRLRGGQLAANARDEFGARRRSPVLAWFDTASGRYLSLARTGQDGHRWLTVSPADTRTLRTRLGELVGEVVGELGHKS
ncbi:ESX secretion-associated protein EspG [Haloechinothrix sp. LS1_15]|uniref:ESX secretion-associated protein EspG n=1 Tax=Haloechinothrix sp. LS1_15 TaxID=2652248 RepID=UPI002944A842|nr:ESX secretion-associated protein EspG [Haloechinothrix sp. LS1_15]MDV6011421.1 ESX secretion-associated protein EspG [Haloechinothrix sp. LS1_15]